MAAIQAFFRDVKKAHRFVSSLRNQRIEGYWSFYGQNHSTRWINFLQDLIHQNQQKLHLQYVSIDNQTWLRNLSQKNVVPSSSDHSIKYRRSVFV